MQRINSSVKVDLAYIYHHPPPFKKTGENGKVHCNPRQNSRIKLDVVYRDLSRSAVYGLVHYIQCIRNENFQIARSKSTCMLDPSLLKFFKYLSIRQI